MPLNENSEVFTFPSDESAVLWRYMDISKFLSLLMNESLYLSRSDLLGDPFEGSFPLANIQEEEEWFAEHGHTRPDDWGRLKASIIPFVYINCWHMSEHESTAMWPLYCSIDSGIAITTTVSILKDVLREACIDLKEHVNMGVVQYIDFEKDKIPWDLGFFRFTSKRKSFEHEKEFRIVTIHNPDKEGVVTISDVEPGFAIPIDLRKLITSVYVAPESPPWFVDLIQELINKFDLEITVTRSSLAAKPRF